MGCSILRNKTTNEIENVLANNGEPSLLYKAINEIVPNKEDALTRWLSVYTDTFANTFGNWQLVAEAIEHIKDIVGVYKITGLQNPNKFLYEVSVQAHSSEQERNGVIKVVGEPIVKIAEKLYPNVSVNGTYPPVLYEFDENNEPLLTQSVKNFIFSTEEEQKKVSPLSGASIKLDILDRVFKERVDGRYTYKRVSADTAMITNVERSKATSNSSARNIAKSLIKLVYNKYDKGVYGFQYQNSPYDPIYIKFSVTDEYIADEFDRLSAEMKEAANSITDPVVKQMSLFDSESSEEIFNENETLANAVYEVLGLINTSEIQLDKPKFNPDNFEATSYPIRINDKYAGVISVNKDGHISSSIGMEGVELEKEFQSKGYGTKVYIALAEQLAKEGKTLKSEAFGKNLINKSANRVWKSLLDKGYAVDRGSYFEVQLKDKPNTNPILQGNQQEQVKKFTELQERLGNKEFLKGAKNAYESSKDLQELGTQEQYNDYIARVSLGIIKNPSSGEYNYESKVRDIVYHFTTIKGKDGILRDGRFKVNKPQEEDISFTENEQWKDDYRSEKISVLLNIKNPTTKNDRYGLREQRLEKPEVDGGKIKTSDTHRAIIVFEPEQIHILGGKQDIEGFKEFANGQTSTLLQKESMLDDAPSFKPLGFTYNSSSSETTDNKSNEYKEILDRLSSKFGIEWVEDNEQESIGRYENGKVYINTSKIKKDTPFHEFAHPFEQLLKRKNINLWKVLASKAKKTTYKGVNVFEKTRALYPELSEEDLISETIVTILGLMASDSSFVSEPSNAGIIDSIKSFFSWLTKYLNSLISNPDKKIKIGDFRADMSFKDVSDVLFKTDNKIDLEDVTLLNATFLQKAEDTFSALKALQSNLTLDESTHTYTFNGKEVGSSVSDLVKAYYTSLFPEKDKSELKKQVDDIIRERGTAIHKDIESIVNRYIDSSTGLKRATPLSMGKVETDADVYTALEAYILKRLNSFDNTTRFMSEVRIYDETKDMAGTIDLLAIKENGELEIFDWKSIQTIKHDYKIDELPWYKEGAYRIQLKEYKRILEEKIGAKVSNAMAIPIEANVTFLQTAEKKINPIYQSIDIGDIDPSQIPEDKNFLLPVVLREQTTNDKLLDDLIKRLYGMYDEILNERVSSHGVKREEKYRKLKTTQEAIRDLQVRKSMNLFIQNGETVIKNARVRIKDGRIDSGYVEETIGQLAIYQEAQKYLGLVLLDDNTPKEIIQKLSSMQSNATHVINLLIDLRKELAEKMANEVGVVNVGRVEKKADWLKSIFRSLSTMPIATIRVFYQKMVKKQNKRDFDTNKKIKELAVLEQELIKWAKANGIKNTDMFNMIYQLDENGKRTGKFISKYSKEFYIEKDKAIQNRDLKWLNENTYFDKEAYEESRKTMEEYVKNEVFSSDPEQNEIKANKMMANWVAMYNAAKHTSAVFNKNNRFLKPQDKHFSKEWVNLNKKENIPLKNVYDEFQNILKYSRKIGMLDEQTNTFIPNIEASKIDRIIFGGAKDLFNIGGVFDKLVIDTGSGFGEINPVTGKQIFRVPVPFLRDLGKEIKDSAGNVTMDYSAKSADLFKVFGIWSAQMYNYEIMKDMEDDANLLYQLELNKKSLVTNAVGTVKMVDGEPVESNNNDVNAKIYSDFMNYYIYNKTSDADNDFAFKIGSKTYSGIKSIRALVQYMSAKVLGFNALSASANLFGGQANAFLQASKGQFFNEADWASSLYSFSKRDKVAIGLLDYFDVLLEDQKMRRANKLSVSKAVEHLTTEKLFELQRGTDKLVQYPVLIAMSKSHMVVNGKIVSIKKYVQDKNNYEGSYSRLNAEQRKELRKKIKKEIKEARIHSIFNTAKVVNDELVIPGLQPDSEAAFAFRNKVRKVNKNILGNSTSDDINRARMTIFGQIMMQFRSWMPQMIIERFGEFTYDSDLEIYQYGKTRQFISDFLSPRILGLIKDIFLGVGEDTIERAKAKYAKLREKRFKNGEDFDITETEYIDIYLANLRSQIRELALLCAVGGLAFVGKPGHDDDKQNDGVNRMLHRAFVKYQNELSFYYLPSSLTQILKSPIPIVSILGDLESFMKHSVTQIFAMATDDEKLDKKSHPFKYFGKMIPIVKEGIQWWGDLDDEFAKENGITR